LPYFTLPKLVDNGVTEGGFIFLLNFFSTGLPGYHLQLRPGQDKAKQCDTNNRVKHGINKSTVNNTMEKKMGGK
jgi:hypothetical protein